MESKIWSRSKCNTLLFTLSQSAKQKMWVEFTSQHVAFLSREELGIYTTQSPCPCMPSHAISLQDSTHFR